VRLGAQGQVDRLGAAGAALLQGSQVALVDVPGVTVAGASSSACGAHGVLLVSRMSDAMYRV
jgi:hypothetical protein